MGVLIWLGMVVCSGWYFVSTRKVDPHPMMLTATWFFLGGSVLGTAGAAFDGPLGLSLRIVATFAIVLAGALNWKRVSRHGESIPRAAGPSTKG